MAKADSNKTQNANTPSVSNRPVTGETISQGREVFMWGVFGILLGLVPTVILIIFSLPTSLPWTVIIPIFAICWACLAGGFVKYKWSDAIHKQVAILRALLDASGALTPDEQVKPGRVPWLPAWIGIFERAFYCLLIGLDVTGGATFIGVWIGLKSAGGWQVWSKGTTYGRAIFFSGLLGNAMSVWFGVIAGLVIRFYTMHTTP